MDEILADGSAQGGPWAGPHRIFRPWLVSPGPAYRETPEKSRRTGQWIKRRYNGP